MHNIKHYLQLCVFSGCSESQIGHNPLYYLKQHFQKRHFFGFTDKRKEYYGRKLVGYSREQMFAVVADVKNYKSFVPFCKKSTVLLSTPGHLKADLQIGFPPILESYTSHVTLIEPQLVKANCVDGSLFDQMETTWRFSHGLRSNPQSCIIDFSINFQFKSLLHSNLAHMFFDKVVKQMEGAFILEAKRRYGKESLPSHPLAVQKS